MHIVIQIIFLWTRTPTVVSRLKLGHQNKRLTFIPPVLQPLDREVSYDIRIVTRHNTLLFQPIRIASQQKRIIISPLPSHDIKVVKTSRGRLQMPLSNDRRLVTTLPQDFRKSLLGAVEIGTSIPGHTISVPIFSSKNSRSAWPA